MNRGQWHAVLANFEWSAVTSSVCFQYAERQGVKCYEIAHFVSLLLLKQVGIIALFCSSHYERLCILYTKTVYF